MYIWVTVKFTHIIQYQKIPNPYSFKCYRMIRIYFLQIVPKCPKNGPLNLFSQVLIIVVALKRMVIGNILVWSSYLKKNYSDSNMDKIGLE